MEGRKTIQEKIANNIGFIAILIVVGIYVGLGLATIQQSGKTIDEIIFESILSLTLGLLIKNLLKLQGLTFGELSESFQNTLTMYGKVITDSIPHMNKIEKFIEYKNKQAFKLVRTSILERVGLNYNDLFDIEGKYIGEEIKEPIKRLFRYDYNNMSREDIAVYKCLTLELTTLVGDDLMADVEGNDKLDPNNMGEDKKQWSKKGMKKQFLMTAATAFIFGYYGLGFITDPDKGELIWKLIQVGSFILFGLFDLMKGYQFMRGPYRNRIIKKANYLEEMQQFDR